MSINPKSLYIFALLALFANIILFLSGFTPSSYSESQDVNLDEALQDTLKKDALYRLDHDSMYVNDTIVRVNPETFEETVEVKRGLVSLREYYQREGADPMTFLDTLNVFDPTD